MFTMNEDDRVFFWLFGGGQDRGFVPNPALSLRSASCPPPGR